MTHDPLCPHSDMTGWVECDDCDLIAKVRADERKRRHAAAELTRQQDGFTTTQWRSSTTATYRLPLWWPPEMVLVPAQNSADIGRKLSPPRPMGWDGG